MTAPLGIDRLPCFADGLATVIAQTPKLTTWYRCLQETGCLALLDEDGPWTVLAPDDSVFARAGERLRELLAPTNADALGDFVESLLVPRSVMSVLLEVKVTGVARVLSLTNLLDQTIVAEIGSAAVSWNGAPTASTILAGNGELYRLGVFPRGTPFVAE